MSSVCYYYGDMKLAEYLSAERGRCARVARAVGRAPAYISQMASGSRPAPPAMVPALVSACDRQVQHWDLRPDDWYLIWPELVGSDSAPAAHRKVA